MALRELQAMQVAYELLSPLDSGAQQRVMAWLSAALADNDGAPAVVDKLAVPVKPVADVPAENAPADSVAQVVAEHAPTEPEVPSTGLLAPAVEAVAAKKSRVAVQPRPLAASDPRTEPARHRKTTGRRAAKATKPAAELTQLTPSRRGERPTGEQFLADLAAAGTFKELAEKYGKSIGTIGNWANQLREQGFTVPVGRQKKA